MNDFLQSLRNGQAEKPRTPKTRKNSDNSYQHTNNSRFNSYGGGGYPNNRSHQMKRPPSHGMPRQAGNQIPAEDLNTTLLADILDNISSHIETLVKNQEYMVNIQERTADMLERQAYAIERIVDHLDLPPNMEDEIGQGMQDDIQPNEIQADEQPAFENHYVTTRAMEEEDTEEYNPGNEWIEPVQPPIAPTPKRTPAKALVEDVSDSKPVLRKRRKIVAKKIIAPEIEITAPKPVKAKQAKAKPAKAKPVAPKQAKATSAKAAPTTSNAKLMPRDTIMDIIQSMRDEGATFDQVAKRLVDLGQPTFSGRGEWHAQTIHRLCSKK